MIPKFLAQLDKKRLTLEAPERALIFHSPENVFYYLQRLKNTIEVVIRQPKSLRSLQQNRYYWGVIVEILSQHTGYEPEEVHEMLKSKFLLRFARINEENIPYTLSTTKLSTKEFKEYIEKIQMWAAEELGIILPDPQEIDIEEEKNGYK